MAAASGRTSSLTPRSSQRPDPSQGLNCQTSPPPREQQAALRRAAFNCFIQNTETGDLHARQGRSATPTGTRAAKTDQKVQGWEVLVAFRASTGRPHQGRPQQAARIALAKEVRKEAAWQVPRDWSYFI